ncbi:MAG: hypothetical protein LBF89_01715 [Bacteroidales bacterium]|nr:hypothetical protein [Bacteroidales bacterium]
MKNNSSDLHYSAKVGTKGTEGTKGDRNKRRECKGERLSRFQVKAIRFGECGMS